MKLYYLSRLVQLALLSAVVLVGLNVLGLANLLPWFSRISPLMTLTTRLAARQWTPYFAGGVLLAFVGVLFPRIFCGWFCPVGACVDLLDSHLHGSAIKAALPGWWWISSVICAGLVIAAGAGYEVAGFTDPLTITAHTVAVLSPDESARQNQADLATGPINVGIIMVTIFIGVLALTVFGRRTWCKILCPLGAMLGTLAYFGMTRRVVSEKCIKCGLCRKVCKMGAVREGFRQTRRQLCVFCRECVKVCPKNAVGFKW